MQLIAHRGGRGFGTENTIEAMVAAVRAGVRAIETDVRETEDGLLVICHDSIIRGRSVARMTYEELISHDPERPLLEELLEELLHWCDFNLEVKEASPERFCEQYDVYQLEARTLISSFDRDFLERFKQMRPGARTGFLYRMPYGKDRKLQGASEIGAEVILPHLRSVDEELIADARELGLEVYAWTVNDLEDFERMRSAGVDGIITDRYLDFVESLAGEGSAQEE